MVCFASLLSGGFITAIVVNPLERNFAKRTFVQCLLDFYFMKTSNLSKVVKLTSVEGPCFHELKNTVTKMNGL